MKPKILVITGYGINCEEETAKCFNWVGGDAEIVHINDIIDGSHKLKNYQIIAFPGGFAYGDDTGSGNALANKIRNNLKEDLLNYLKEDKLIIGICNGMQIMANLGLIPNTDIEKGERTARARRPSKNLALPVRARPSLKKLTRTACLPDRQAALMRNLHVTLECRWIYVKNISKKCVWTQNIDMMHLPIAHGEGNFYVTPAILKKMKENDQIVFKFVNEDGSPANNKFPANPNGAMEDITGVCDPTGKIFAMMPHPERFNSWTNEDGWELKKEKLIREQATKSPNSPPPFPQEGDGLKIFRNGVNYFK